MQNGCRKAQRAVLTAILFGFCAFVCLAALWFVPGWLRQAFPSLWFVGSFPVYELRWNYMSPPISAVSIAFGVVMGMLYLTGWHKVVASFKGCLCVVVATALLTAPAFGMYWHYADILAGFVPPHATQKILSGLLPPLAAIGLSFYGLDYIIICTLTGCLGTLWLGQFCRRTLWRETQSATLPALSASRAVSLGILLYAGCLGVIFLALNGDIKSRSSTAQAMEAVFTKGTAEEIIYFMDTHAPNLLKPLKPAYGYKGNQRSALVFAAANPNPDAFAAVAQRAPITDNKSIEQYLEAFSFALNSINIPVLKQIAHIYKNRQHNYTVEKGIRYSDADKKIQHIVSSMLDLRRRQPQPSPTDVHAMLQACADMGALAKITLMNLREDNVDMLESLRNEGWLNDAAMDKLLDDHVRSVQCNGKITKELLRLGANPNRIIPANPLLEGADHCPVLAAALIFCTEDAIRQLIEAGVEVHARCQDGRSIPQFLDDLIKKSKERRSKTNWLEQRRALFDRLVSQQPPQVH